ncbi:hypothetical protein FACS1894147_08920 [Spirochaetia bacterium]|nr:hypothetical protein FACS1894147_08920 [Spirochaetia bacterium]
MTTRIMYGLLFGAMAMNGFAADEIFSCKIGSFDVYMLVESRRQGGNSAILLNASPEQIARYIPGGSYESETNTFVIRQGTRVVVVDTGFGGAIFDSMKKLGIDPAQVEAVLLTHLHGDHIGGLQKGGKPLFPNAKVYLAKQEKDYWTLTNVNAGAVAALAAYGSKVETFLPAELGATLTEILPGISPIAAFGHTPGHTLYLVGSGGSRLLIWGDLMHVQNIQFPLPDVSVSYDTDPKAAAATRRKVLEYAAANKIAIGGMHLVYPAIGTVRTEGSGWRFVPAGM